MDLAPGYYWFNQPDRGWRVVEIKRGRPGVGLVMLSTRGDEHRRLEGLDLVGPLEAPPAAVASRGGEGS